MIRLIEKITGKLVHEYRTFLGVPYYIRFHNEEQLKKKLVKILQDNPSGLTLEQIRKHLQHYENNNTNCF